jgi:hypothetical protein
MPLSARKALGEYKDNLLWRVRKAECFYCGAKAGERCITPRTRRRTQGCHASRHNEAKRLGFVQGRWFDEKKYGVSL